MAIPIFVYFSWSLRKVSMVLWVYREPSISKVTKLLSSEAFFIIPLRFPSAISSEISSPKWVSFRDTLELTPPSLMSSRRDRYFLTASSAWDGSLTCSPRLSMVARIPWLLRGRTTLIASFLSSPHLPYSRPCQWPPGHHQDPLEGPSPSPL